MIEIMKIMGRIGWSDLRGKRVTVTNDSSAVQYLFGVCCTSYIVLKLLNCRVAWTWPQLSFMDGLDIQSQNPSVRDSTTFIYTSLGCYGVGNDITVVCTRLSMHVFHLCLLQWLSLLSLSFFFFCG